VEVKSSLLPVFPPPAPDVPTNATQQQTKRPKSVGELPPLPGMGGGTIVMGERKGSLLLVGDFADGAQFQPPQLATAQVMITPVLPVGAQGFEISPGEVKVLEPKRVPGGIQFILEEFDTTRLVLCTTDMGIYDRLRATVERVRPRAVPWRSGRRSSSSQQSRRPTPDWKPTVMRFAPMSISRCVAKRVSRQSPPTPRTCWTRPKPTSSPRAMPGSVKITPGPGRKPAGRSARSAC